MNELFTCYKHIRTTGAITINDNLGCIYIVIIWLDVPLVVVWSKIEIYLMQIVDQKALQPLSTIDRPAVLCIAAWFGRVRLIDNIELQP